MIKKYLFKIFIAGWTPDNSRIISTLNNIFEERFKDQYSLEVIEVIDNLELAGEEKIFVTPTLIKYSPEPVRKIIGDLSEKEKVLSGLNLATQ